MGLKGGGGLEPLFGLIPTYWPVKAYWLASVGDVAGGYLLVGLLYSGLLVGLLGWRFARHFSR
ncbi:MAG: hypothetical protein U5L04_00050 [Trueperaceae bacterium]|nr:hypothetical protein [Trueperaceae bacterium]